MVAGHGGSYRLRVCTGSSLPHQPPIPACSEPIVYSVSGGEDHVCMVRWAALHGRIDILEKAVANGVRLHNTSEFTPSHIQCMSDAMYPLCPSPMTLAVLAGQLGCVEWLLRHEGSLEEQRVPRCIPGCLGLCRRPNVRLHARG